MSGRSGQTPGPRSGAAALGSGSLQVDGGSADGIEPAGMDAATRIDGEAALPADDGAESWDAHIRTVFEDYLSIREKCGESVAGMSLDKFRAKLETNRQQLVSKYSCRSARFSVYIKDGKAAIKATPVR